MATWVTPIESQTDPDAPLTSELGKRWDNNVIAAFEGAAGAPRLAIKNLPAQSGSTVTLSGLDAFGGIEFSIYLVGNTGGGSPTGGRALISFSDDNGATYSTPVLILTNGTATGEFVSGDGVFNFTGGDVSVAFVRGGGLGAAAAGVTNTTLAGSSNNITHVRFTTQNNGMISVRATANGGQSAT